MKWLRQHFDTGFIVMQVWVDGFAVLGSCLLGFLLFKVVLGEAAQGNLADYRQLMVLITGITLVCFWSCGMYRWRKSILNVEEYAAAFKATALAFLCTTAAMYLLMSSVPDPAAAPREYADWQQRVASSHFLSLLAGIHEPFGLSRGGTPRILFLCIFLCIFFVTVVQRSLLFRISSVLHARGYGNTNVVVFGTGRLALQVQQKLRLFPTLGFNFVGFIDDDPALHQREVRGFPVLGGREQLPELVQRRGIRRLVIADDRLEEEELVGLCRMCESCGIEYQVVPKLYHFFSQRFSVDKLDSIPLISVAGARDQPVYRAVKRALDLSISALVLMGAAPLLVLIAFLIKRESPGPIFFTQVRVGLKGRPFRIIKFRSMYSDMCRDEVTPRSSTDPRITKVGRYLRSSSLDELPQFWNVFRGDMSMVGPRPEMPFIVDTYSEVDRLRLDAKPGITGLWQVSDARKQPIHENLDYDLYYIDNQSIFLDLVILFLTAATVLRPRATF